MACLFCFSKDPLSQDDLKGKYGASYAPFANYDNKYDITMCQAPCKEPCCCLASAACLCPAQIYMRHKVLNHLEPGSGWSNYTCCQSQFGGCCCIQPGQMGEKTCPLPCMCLEAFCCPGLAVSASSGVVRDHYQLGMDEDDVRLIRCSNCLFYFSFILSCIAMCTDCEGDDAFAQVVDCISDVVFCSVAACMTAQVNREVNLREASAPQGQAMER
ncbi:hypothetical protein CTEN210_04214 [Chaetoceros tenuissimus]|uniref:Uncharacterized protein n=1 Tax=Chaetoceros tenuissimus TaxID=426638 RepID=A0AAD3CL86_9STRA|nr:hypothetical protein CTEN210_04214 [Chaetoceros tenuissimus]